MAAPISGRYGQNPQSRLRHATCEAGTRMYCRIIVACLVALLVASADAKDPDLDLDRIKALANSYFRDTADIPLTVAVTTVITDGSGQVKHRSQSTASMIFNGYVRDSGKIAPRANSGVLNPTAERDSMGGDMVAFFAGGLLFRNVPGRKVEIEPPAEADQPMLVVVKDGECPELSLTPRWIFPRNPCGAAQFRLGPGPDGRPVFQHFTFDGAGDPASAKIPYLGDVKVLAFHADVDFKEVVLPPDTNPLLLPLEAVTSVTTSKGRVTVMNLYSVKK